MKKKVSRKRGAPTALGHDPLAWIDAEESGEKGQADEATDAVPEEVPAEAPAEKIVEASEENEAEQQDVQDVAVIENKAADEAESGPRDEPVEERGPETVCLEEILGIAQVEAFHKTLLSTLNSATETGIEIDSTKLQQIDAAGVQLLYTFIHDARNRGLNVSWKSTSEALEKSAGQLGLSEYLGL